MHVYNSGIKSLQQLTCLHCLLDSSDGNTQGPHIARPRQAQALRLRRLLRQLLPWQRRAAARLQPPRMRACTGARRLGSACNSGRDAAANWHPAACCSRAEVYACLPRLCGPSLLSICRRSQTMHTPSPCVRLLRRACIGHRCRQNMKTALALKRVMRPTTQHADSA